MTARGDELKPLTAGPDAIRLELWLTPRDAELAGAFLATCASAAFRSVGDLPPGSVRSVVEERAHACAAVGRQLVARARGYQR